MLDNLAFQMNAFWAKIQIFLYPWLLCFAALWAINIINWVVLGSRLNILGIYPRHLLGLIGIIFSPILHYNFNHLFFNSIPLFALGLGILAMGLETFYQTTIEIVLLGGLLVWLFGRRAIHIGASGLVSGYFGFIMANAYLNPTFTTFLLAAIVLYYFGSIFLGIIPQEEKVSWESHLFGFLSGIASAFIPIGIWDLWLPKIS